MNFWRNTGEVFMKKIRHVWTANIYEQGDFCVELDNDLDMSDLKKIN